MPARQRGESKHSKRRIDSVYDQAEALELRKAGFMYREIGAKQGVSEQQAWRRVEAALQRVLQEPSDAVRALECERLDKLFQKAYTQATRPNGRLDPVAVSSCLAIMARRAKLVGIDLADNKAAPASAAEIAAEIKAQMAATEPTPVGGAE